MIFTADGKSVWTRAGRWAVSSAAVLLAVAGAVGCSAQESADAPIPPPTPAAAPVEAVVPETTTVPPTPISNEELSTLLNEAAGKVVVANFWATYCLPCVSEMPELSRFYEQYKDKDVVFLSLSVDTPADLESGKVASFIKEHRLPFPVKVIESRDPASIAALLQVDWGGSLPATFIFGLGGELQKQFEEEVTTEELAAVVDPLLKLNAA